MYSNLTKKAKELEFISGATISTSILDDRSRSMLDSIYVGNTTRVKQDISDEMTEKIIQTCINDEQSRGILDTATYLFSDNVVQTKNFLDKTIDHSITIPPNGTALFSACVKVYKDMLLKIVTDQQKGNKSYGIIAIITDGQSTEGPTAEFTKLNNLLKQIHIHTTVFIVDNDNTEYGKYLEQFFDEVHYSSTNPSADFLNTINNILSTVLTLSHSVTQSLKLSQSGNQNVIDCIKIGNNTYQPVSDLTDSEAGNTNNFDIDLDDEGHFIIKGDVI